MFKCRIKSYQRKQGSICYVVIRLVVTGNRLVEVWDVKSGGDLATSPNKRKNETFGKTEQTKKLTIANKV